MNTDSFKAMIVKEDNGKYIREIGNKNIADLPEGEVLIKVKYSSLNYKDALSAIGNKGVTRNYPHTPGIDAAGVVESSDNHLIKPGDQVVVTGYDLGMNTSGGFGQYIRVPAAWVVKLPEKLTLKESMIYGTAGFTASLSLYKMESLGLAPTGNEVLVTGASGGVGSMAVAILSKAGYNVVAATGKPGKEEYFRKLGAKSVIHRDDVNDTGGKPMLKGRWQAVIDTVGGNILATAIKSTRRHGLVAVCGLTLSPEFNTTVFPFLLREVCLIGIDSAECPMTDRAKIWNKISNEWRLETLADIYTECSLEELDNKIDLILNGKISGRTVVNLEL
ncbi:MAG: alcohol dehydrogenase [Candidatus Scalindua rubra]|uniref:Alcohol dehydrogenase n=1 Tax=Candidatus Scalindua rubra TaxID=1872076 RepID=A0A1E3XD73_9BACT|nr:MAG: alcohol dehydrogenase [Candidatus Scalindua rubra]